LPDYEKGRYNNLQSTNSSLNINKQIYILENKKERLVYIVSTRKRSSLLNVKVKSTKNYERILSKKKV
jgi:hypothetical protein